MARIDLISAEKKVKAAIASGLTSRAIERKLRTRASTASLAISTLLDAEFEAHRVTRELSGGPEAPSLQSNWPQGQNGGAYGNIQSYFGLTDSNITSGIAAIKRLFIKRTISITRTGTIFTIRIRFPDVEEYYAATPPPQGTYGVSWLEAIEKSLVKNFKNFLFRERGIKGSRSGTGVQVKNKLRAASGVPRIPYITEIYKSILGIGGKGAALVAAAIRRKL